MKKIVIAAIAALAMQTAFSQSSVDKEFCSLIANIGTSAMSMRQAGVPLQRVLQKVETMDKEFRSIIREVVLEAYELPQAYSSNQKREMIIDFESHTLLTCLRTRS